MKLNTFTLENDDLRVVISSFGGKITSMFDKRNRREWLFQSEGAEFDAGDGREFTKDVAFGCDEMFPTIVPEHSPQADGGIVNLPDHGELWSSEWELVSKDRDGALMTFCGKILPYRFERNCRVSGGSLLCSYSVENLSAADLPALWTPHPLFSFLRETEIVLPSECRSISQAGDGGALGDYRNRLDWGEQGFVEGAGKLLLPGSLEEGRAYKFYIAEKLKEGRLQLRDERGVMTMTWPAETLPWLGLWINNGGWGGQRNIAPEPATAPFDSPSRAEQAGVPAVWNGGETRTWELSYRFDS